MSEPLNIFVSHASEYAELAMTLKRSLEALAGDERLDIRVSVTMPGGSDWRDWIENNVRSADLFLLLYPDERMDLNWCNYELGFFRRRAPHRVPEECRYRKTSTGVRAISSLQRG